jgi:hypothetical protein
MKRGIRKRKHILKKKEKEERYKEKLKLKGIPVHNRDKT